MKTRAATGGLCALALLLGAGCNLPGKPKAGPEVPRPEEVMQFDKLYGDNCAGCHGVDGRNGSATNLANPEYEAWIDDATLRDVIAKGEKQSLMPAFALESGGVLTDQQIDALVTLATNPFKYLVGPRVIAAVFSLPILVAIGDTIGIMGGYIVGTRSLGFNSYAYIKNTVTNLHFDDVSSGLIKAAVFGFIDR